LFNTEKEQYMPLSINTNIASMTAQRSFLNSNSDLETAFERLATGKRINSSVDDAAGLAIGTDLESRVRGLNQAIRNTNDGISMVQIAEGALDEATTILQRMRDLSVQAASGGLSVTERGYLDTEQAKLATALDSALNQAKFDSVDLIGTSATTLTLQTGADTTDTTDLTLTALSAGTLQVGENEVSLTGQEVVEFSLTDAQVNSESGNIVVTVGGVETTVSANSKSTVDEIVTLLNANGTFAASYTAYAGSDGDNLVIVSTSTSNISSSDNTINAANVDLGNGAATDVAGTIRQEGGTFGITAIDAALTSIASNRASLGALQSQLESVVRNLANVAENTATAAGRIMDTDYAAETANLTRAQILQQAATSILAQANTQPQAVLTLLQQ
jgi:flagellin